ncbi:metal-binding protein [Pilimelia terevasa]|uniref:Metal-binding protein n=1 Tax=Pilimelia terevasa TaxID=53372 RepID=A0A8J3BU27_9ACTN|nr:YceD family protein [Pilimelia terevasa]GGK28306.1 metal-binding protein [Pilimelia terevasa]
MPKHSEPQLDPRAPLVLDTKDLPRRPGAMRTLTRVAPSPADLGVEMIGVPEGAELSLDLRLESVSEGVLVSGRVSGPLAGECGRCLRELRDELVVTVQELFAYEDSATDETTDEDEIGRVRNDLIDLEPALRDAVVLTLPTNPVCRADCRGLCPDCGALWDDLPADHSHQQVDPRWAELRTMTMTEE